MSKNDRTFYVSCNGTVTSKKRGNSVDTIRARNLREAIARNNIDRERARNVRAFERRAGSTSIGSALLDAFGSDALRAIVR